MLFGPASTTPQLTPTERLILGDAFGSGWLADGLADAPDTPLDLDGWLLREDALGEAIQAGTVTCRDDLDVRMLVEAFEYSTAFTGLDYLSPAKIASSCKVAYSLQAKLQNLAGRPVRLPPEFS